MDLGEREQIEETSRQARAMEAVGRLAGGVAHHFNNLLTVILGNLELLSPELPDGPLYKQATLALRGAQRGSEITHRLLAFSRRQPLRPETLDLNAFVTGFADALRQAVGEAVALEMTLAPDIPLVSVDRAQLEGALLELAANARDAMPNGGRMLIETAHGPPADPLDGANAESRCVLLAVTDTGSGMRAFVRERACEPFFTTAEAGRRLGLGLSMVYGFVVQSGGGLALDSEAGVGTTVRLYLPPSGTPVRGNPKATPPA